ncbi:hypothetical protein [Cupriavidus pauculus]|uniref:hypothetical protein n=1 Tax=Cupriavidus pauculus TaxID=82633 RepID=UPI001EE23C3F|nr:hypothetical protein [Cupriavidus pauculus]GJG98247.1 hypothetical protein CBA19C6_27180 [Cupriavidus pauculus]
MKIDIDFSIFYSPTTAYGSVTGSIDVQSCPNVGDVVDLLSGRNFFADLLGKLKVISMTQVDESGDFIYGLEDVLVTSHMEAQELAEKLEAELGLFFVDYER